MSTSSSFVSAIFFEQQPENGEYSYFFNSDAAHINIPLLADNLDPSFNVALSRGFYEQIYSTQVTTMKDYIELLNNNESFHKLSLIMHEVNQCNTLIEGDNFKIYFLEYKGYLKEKLQLQALSIDQTAQETQLFFKQYNLQEYLKSNLHAEKTIFCILNSEDKKCMDNFYEGLFQGQLQKENQNWISVNLHNMIPIEEELFKKIKGFIITGSHHDAYDISMPWVPFSYDLFNKIIYPKEDNNQRLIAICWGHQAIGHGCGGKASRMPHKEIFQLRDKIVIQDVNVIPDFNLSKILPQPFYGIKCHGDYVFELPPGATQICTSQKVDIEGMAFGKRALTFQFHPEFNKMMLFKILEETREDTEFKRNQVKIAEQSFSEGEQLSNQALLSFLKVFLSS